MLWCKRCAIKKGNMRMLGRFNKHRCPACAAEYKRRKKSKTEKRQAKRVWKRLEQNDWKENT